MIPERCQNLTSFLLEVQNLAEADSATWQGKTVTKGNPINAKNVMTFLKNNTDWLNSYRDPELKNALDTISKRVSKEIYNQSEAKQLIEVLQANIENLKKPLPQLPTSIGAKILSHVAEEPEEDDTDSVKQALSTFEEMAQVNKEWKGFSQETKVNLINAKKINIDDLEFKDSKEALNFILSCGDKLHYLKAGQAFRDEDWQQIFNKCPKLQEVIVTESNNTDAAFAGMAKLSDLQKVVLTYNPKLTRFPDLQFLQHLKRIQLNEWPLARWPDFSKFTHMEQLTLGYTKDSINLAALRFPLSLQTLQLFELSGLKDVPPLPNTNIQSLKVINCEKLDKLSFLGKPSKLTELLLQEARSLKEIPDLSQTHLQKFTVDGSNASVLPDLARLHDLREARILDCEKITAIPTMGSKIEILEIANCPKLPDLPSMDHLTEMRELSITECKKLEKVPSLKQQAKLNKLELVKCKHLQKMPEINPSAHIKQLVVNSNGFK